MKNENWHYGGEQCKSLPEGEKQRLAKHRKNITKYGTRMTDGGISIRNIMNRIVT